jgi:hypothetical protein
MRSAPDTIKGELVLQIGEVVRLKDFLGQM